MARATARAFFGAKKIEGPSKSQESTAYLQSTYLYMCRNFNCLSMKYLYMCVGISTAYLRSTCIRVDISTAYLPSTCTCVGISTAYLRSTCARAYRPACQPCWPTSMRTTRIPPPPPTCPLATDLLLLTLG